MTHTHRIELTRTVRAWDRACRSRTGAGDRARPAGVLFGGWLDDVRRSELALSSQSLADQLLDARPGLVGLEAAPTLV